MWIIRTALDRPYTFIVLALLILLISPVVILRTPTDIFPNIDIPVVAVGWQYTGLNAPEMEGRITTQFERGVTTLVDNIEHVESISVNGISLIKIFLQRGASIDRANSQVTAATQSVIRLLPAGITPPLVINYSASTVPILQIGLSGEGLSEQQLNDVGLNFLRTRLITVPGAAVPYPYGGKQRQIMVNLNPPQLQAKGLAATDVVAALGQQNLVLPSGSAKIGSLEYTIGLNASTQTVEELNDIPIRIAGNAPIFIRDIAQVSDGFAPQTNVVRQDGRRGSLVTIFKSGNASTISVVENIRKMLPVIAPSLPPELKMQPLADQSVFVNAAVQGVIHEGVIAAALTGLMILIFLGSWRSTVIIAISIPLSVLSSIITLSFLGETINLMTLGGLALAVGILVDDATVTIENIERFLEEGHTLEEAILEGAGQIAVPAMVSTFCICIVFLPMFFLSGVARYLFVPLAEAVIFAMLASYILSRTLVPTLAMYLLKAKHHNGNERSFNPLILFQRAFERSFEALRGAYRGLLTALVHWRWVFVPVFLLVCCSSALLVPWLGEDFFPSSDSGAFTLHVRARSGTRIEETARLCDLVEGSIRKMIPAHEVDNIIDNIGIPYSSINYTYNTSGIIGPGDADILVSLKKGHKPTADYVRRLRKSLPDEFPDATFYFMPGDMVTQILNFGVPAPINVQIEGTDIHGNRVAANRILEELRHVPGAVDLRIHQRFDYPKLNLSVDRTKAAQGGFTQRDIANSLLVSLSGSFQTTPSYFLNPANGVNYSLVTQTPQYMMQSLDAIRNIPISAAGVTRPEILSNYATIGRSQEMAVINHYNLRRVINIYASVQDRALGAVGKEIEQIVDANRKLLPRGSTVTVSGQLATMRESYTGLIYGLGAAIVLVYLLIVVNFQSWLDPFIIITALPAALAGIILFLFLTNTRLSVPALMGSIMCMGVATANSILVISFAKERLLAHGDAIEAAIEAGFTRFRPVLMTALAMLIGMVPMALGFGDGGEQNAPLGRAVIGGLLCATVATLLFVPVVFSLLHKKKVQSS
ncbi:efflux RND transporter permease subunit [Bryobacter aggregatus]|uniref:efflux RND transporter permease subunit n=1 Tax=Bryobacter aggregatus TaxID=360054 RepID=UPI0004E18185|nr:efflux RND transporter permease subunit [Bryobacter aggregatus]